MGICCVLAKDLAEAFGRRRALCGKKAVDPTLFDAGGQRKYGPRIRVNCTDL